MPLSQIKRRKRERKKKTHHDLNVLHLACLANEEPLRLGVVATTMGFAILHNLKNRAVGVCPEAEVIGGGENEKEDPAEPFDRRLLPPPPFGRCGPRALSRSMLSERAMMATR